jgi:hypothetical protein
VIALGVFYKIVIVAVAVIVAEGRLRSGTSGAQG